MTPELKTAEIETATGSFLDSWIGGPSIGRMLVRMPLWQTIKEFALRHRRYFFISGNPIPWGLREELDAELGARMKARIDAED